MKSITIDFPGLSFLEVKRQFPDCFYDQDWYNKEAFANEKIPAGRWKVSLKPAKDSLDKTWDEQQGCLKKGEEVPPTTVLVYATCKHFKNTGERSFEKAFVRTSDIDSDGHRVYVGNFDSRGLYVSNRWDDHRDDDLGVSVARKSGTLEPVEDLTLESAIAKVKEAGYVIYKSI